MAGLIGLGLFGVGMFLIIKLGIIKSWFIQKTVPGLLSARMVYAALPFGISFLLLAIFPLLPNYDSSEPSLGVALALLFGPVFGFWFMGRPPKWLAPQWLQWLEQEYGYCVDILLEEAQKMNRWAWEARVWKQEGMQAWIDEVIDHRRQEVDFAWEAEKLYLIRQQVKKKHPTRHVHSVKPGMVVEGYVPVHRRGDIALTREGIDEVVRVNNARYTVVYKEDLNLK